MRAEELSKSTVAPGSKDAHHISTLDQRRRFSNDPVPAFLVNAADVAVAIMVLRDDVAGPDKVVVVDDHNRPFVLDPLVAFQPQTFYV